MEGAAFPTGRASDESVGDPLFPTARLGATSCPGCCAAAAAVDILEPPEFTATVAGAGAGLASIFAGSGFLFSGFTSAAAGLAPGCVVFAGCAAGAAVEDAAGVLGVVEAAGAVAGVAAAVTGALCGADGLDAL